MNHDRPTQNRPQSDAAEKQKRQRARLLSSIRTVFSSPGGKRILEWLHTAAPIDRPLCPAWDDPVEWADEFLDTIRATFSRGAGPTVLAWLCHAGGADRPVFHLPPAGQSIDLTAVRVREGRRRFPAFCRLIVAGEVPAKRHFALDSPGQDGFRQIHLEILDALETAKEASPDDDDPA